MSRSRPLISEESASYLARVVNRAAASFDVAALSNEEAIEVWMLLNNLVDRLWRAHQPALLPLVHALLDRLGFPPEDEPEGTGGDLH